MVVSGEAFESLKGTKPRDVLLLNGDLTIRAAQFLCQSRSCSISRQAPDTLRFFVAKHVTVAVVQEHAKVSRSRRIPAVLNRYDLPGSVRQIQPQGTLVRLVSGLALHTDNLFMHGPEPLCDSPPTPRSRRRRGK